MADKFYATSEIKFVKSEGKSTTLNAGGTTVQLLTSAPEYDRIREGEEVDKSKFSDEDWQALVDAGAVTTDKSKVYGTPSTKTADVQAEAQGRQPGNGVFPEQEEDVEALNAAANERAAKEKAIMDSFEAGGLSDEEREAIADVPPGNQRNVIHRMRAAAQEKALSDDKSKTTSSKSPAPAAQKSTT